MVDSSVRIRDGDKIIRENQPIKLLHNCHISTNRNFIKCCGDVDSIVLGDLHAVSDQVSKVDSVCPS